MATEYTEEPCSGLWRSEDMQLVSMAFQRSSMKRAMLAIGELGCVQLCDLNTDVQAYAKEFTSEIRRCEEVHRKLRFFKDEMHRWEVMGWKSRGGGKFDALKESALEDMEAEVGKVYPDLKKQSENYDSMKQQWLQAYESWMVHASNNVRRLCRNARDEASLGVLAGTVPSSKVHLMRRQVFSCTKGNANAHFDEMPVPDHEVRSFFGSADAFDKHTFLFVFSSQNICTRLKRLAQAMEANIVMETALTNQGREAEEAKQKDAADDSMRMMTKGRESIRAILMQVAPHLRDWTRAASIHKTVAYQLNMLQVRQHTASGVAWVPKCHLQRLKDTLTSEGGQAESVVTELQTPSHVMPPTHFETNFFTETFQGIVNSYGTPRYKEINPAVFTIVTFPWLFGVMYGDIGHGLLITLTALIFIVFEKKLMQTSLNEMVEMVFGARYLLLLMGLFATYAGFLYNDTFGMMLQYSNSEIGELAFTNQNKTMMRHPACNGLPQGSGCNVCLFGKDATPEWHKNNPVPVTSGPYFGVDAQWSGAGRKLDVYNSFKMKGAIVLGVTQMMLGLVLKFLNNSYFNEMKHIYFGFIPEVIFLSCTFGYMSLLIMLKWASPFQTACSVSLLETMVNFFLSPGHVPNELYSGQTPIQVMLLLIAVVCVVPFMLFPIPYIEWKYHKDHHAGRDDDEEEDGRLLGGANVQMVSPEENDLVSRLFPKAPYKFDMQEVVIKQVIHSIEFVLGSVSNTASYLRLWALSLAHAQLSEVFLEFLVMLPLEQKENTAIIWYMGFAVWLTATLGILVGMEALSAFLHALRLHWVEFQNKFYIADGTAFNPLSFDAVRQEADAE